MTVNLQIAPEVEARLAVRARSAGESIEEFIERLLQQEVEAEEPTRAPMTGAEKAAAFQAWAESFPKDMPLLNLEDISRESMYRRDD